MKNKIQIRVRRGRETFHKSVQRMEFQFKKCKKRRSQLTEHKDIVTHHAPYSETFRKVAQG
jgi:hypothetical protein